VTVAVAAALAGEAVAAVAADEGTGVQEVGVSTLLPLLLGGTGIPVNFVNPEALTRMARSITRYSSIVSTWS